MKNKATRNNMRGFSLMEMLVTVLILVILFALAMIPISKIQKNLRQTELDSRAEMIFSAVQNRMTRLQAAGQDSIVGTVKGQDLLAAAVTQGGCPPGGCAGG